MKPPLTPQQVVSKLTALERDSLCAQILFIASEDLRSGPAAGLKPTARRLQDLLEHGKKLYRQHSG
jgi:hypothetical protein